MRTARPILPTDLLSLAAYNWWTFRNEARPRERLTDGDGRVRPLETALEQWLPLRTSRTAWISSRRQRLQGMVSARPRGSRQAWEIDCLIDVTPNHDAAPPLLERAIAEAGRSGAEKLFLRLPTASPLLDVVRGAGFMPYQEETLLRRPRGRLAAEPDSDARPLMRQDLYLAFRLYNRVTPVDVRRAEAATFNEWQAAQERRWLRHGAELVIEGSDGFVAVIRHARSGDALVFDALVQPECLDRLPGLVARAAADTDAGALVAVLPDWAEGQARLLEDMGFQPAGGFVCLYRRTTRPLKVGKLRPAVAKTAITP